MTESAPDDDQAQAPGRLLDFDPEDLTLDELEELEELLGTALDGMLTGDTPKGRALKAIVWIMIRRDNPEATLEDAGRYKIRDLGLELAGAGDAGDEEGSSSGN